MLVGGGCGGDGGDGGDGAWFMFLNVSFVRLAVGFGNCVCIFTGAD